MLSLLISLYLAAHYSLAIKVISKLLLLPLQPAEVLFVLYFYDA